MLPVVHTTRSRGVACEWRRGLVFLAAPGTVVDGSLEIRRLRLHFRHHRSALRPAHSSGALAERGPKVSQNTCPRNVVAYPADAWPKCRCGHHRVTTSINACVGPPQRRMGFDAGMMAPPPPPTTDGVHNRWIPAASAVSGWQPRRAVARRWRRRAVERERHPASVPDREPTGGAGRSRHFRLVRRSLKPCGGSVHLMSIEYEDVSVVALETLGIAGILGGMVPIARSEVSMGWLALLPVGLLSIVLAVRRLASMKKTSRLDISQRRILLRSALGCTLAGLLSSWLALAAYQSVILQAGGLLAGAGCLFCASVMFGGWYHREAE